MTGNQGKRDAINVLSQSQFVDVVVHGCHLITYKPLHALDQTLDV